MENEIENRVKGITRRLAKVLEENSGIETQLENKEIEDYIRIVLNEKERTLKKINNLMIGKPKDCTSENFKNHSTFWDLLL